MPLLGSDGETKSRPHRWRHPRPYNQGLPDTPSTARIREIIAHTLWAENDNVSAPVTFTASSTGPVAPKAYAQMNNVVFYERGVGTGAFLNRLFDSALGSVKTSVEHTNFFRSIISPAIKFSFFGFSRGAFTARSLVWRRFIELQSLPVAGISTSRQGIPLHNSTAWLATQC
jgi:hypothetical protein